MNVFLEAFSPYDAATSVFVVWKSYSEATFSKCWNKLLIENSNFGEEDDLSTSSELMIILSSS